MFVKVLLLVFVGTVLSSTLKDHEISHQEVKSPFFELPCMKHGGICMHRNECPAGKQVGVEGLCPLQQEQGVECCYSAARKSAITCRSHGGECMPASWKCPQYLQFSSATDCEANEQCCIPVNK